MTKDNKLVELYKELKETQKVTTELELAEKDPIRKSILRTTLTLLILQEQILELDARIDALEDMLGGMKFVNVADHTRSVN